MHFIFVLSLILSLSLSFPSFLSEEKATSGITTMAIAVKSIITLTSCADKDHNHVHTHPHELIEDEHADHETDDQNHEGDDHDHDHIAKEAGSNGARLLTNVEPYAELLAKPDRSVQTALLDNSWTCDH